MARKPAATMRMIKSTLSDAKDTCSTTLHKTASRSDNRDNRTLVHDASGTRQASPSKEPPAANW
eukprot:1290325-Amphidinium_carterae.1